MATLTIRNLDDSVADALEARAAAHGRSLEAEVRWILTNATRKTTEVAGLGSRIHDRFAGLGDVEVPRSEELARPAQFDA